MRSFFAFVLVLLITAANGGADALAQGFEPGLNTVGSGTEIMITAHEDCRSMVVETSARTLPPGGVNHGPSACSGGDCAWLLPSMGALAASCDKRLYGVESFLLYALASTLQLPPPRV